MFNNSDINSANKNENKDLINLVNDVLLFGNPINDAHVYFSNDGKYATILFMLVVDKSNTTVKVAFNNKSDYIKGLLKQIVKGSPLLVTGHLNTYYSKKYGHYQTNVISNDVKYG